MLFNSFLFIFFFLPVTLVVYYRLADSGFRSSAIAWLVICSLFFYGWWNPPYLLLIICSILVNFTIGRGLQRIAAGAAKKLLLTVGIAFNLSLLGYFKYANFFIDQLNVIFTTGVKLEPIMLPLAISFFTFQQIAYLVDVYRSDVQKYRFLHYCLFVTFFPQLIAGPIVQHHEMFPQFARLTQSNERLKQLSFGMVLFLIGLSKKVLFADSLALYASPIFDGAERMVALSFWEGWSGALAYSLQLYFDFSGYSDMALGLAKMMNINLPINFNSPYKATSIIDFWRRWHITLSRFLRDYLYIPLGGNRVARPRYYTNLFLTMLLGGIWHGAGWTFVIWGALHGFCLIINHLWRSGCKALLGPDRKSTPIGIFCGRVLTLLCVIIGWVFFRAESVEGAWYLLGVMLGTNGFGVPQDLADQLVYLQQLVHTFGIIGSESGLRIDLWSGMQLIFLLGLVALFFPNSNQLIEDNGKWFTFSRYLLSKPLLTGIAGSSLFFYVFINLSREAEFLYFNF
ncbi:MAG: MBOAT family protein [Desulfobulbaceae bacterium]|nr:MAG: MBOAT family protein [Desulfobulbaceae bacterium]